MKYVFLIYQPANFDPKSLSQDEHAAIAAEYRSLTGEPNVTPGLPLGAVGKAITVRHADGQPAAADGAYLGDAGAVGGYMVVEAETEDAAIALAARVPAVRLGGAVEVRPCEVYW